MTFGFSNVEVISDPYKSSFDGVKHLIRVGLKKNRRTGNGEMIEIALKKFSCKEERNMMVIAREMGSRGTFF